MWIAVCIVGWFALGYLGARVFYKYHSCPTVVAESILLWVLGPFALLGAVVEYFESGGGNASKFWDTVFKVRGK